MTRREELYERYHDALFALLMEEVSETQGKKALEENERLNQDTLAEVPPEISARCMDCIRRAFRRQRTVAARRTVLRLSRGIAAVLLAVMLLFTGAFAFSDSFRSAALNLFIEYFGDRIDFNFRHSEGTGMQIQVGWVPEGLELTEKIEESTSTAYIYLGKAGQNLTLVFYQTKGSSFSFDSEDADEVTNISINGRQELLIVKGNSIQMIQVTPDKSMLIQVAAENVSKSDVIKFAESVTY